MVHPGAAAAVARDAVLGSGVAKRQLAAAAPAADQAGEQRLAMLEHAVMPAGRNIACHHRADRFEPFPAHIAVMGAGLQGEPFVPRLAAGLHLDAVGGIGRRRARLTIGVGPAVDWVLDDPMDGT